MSPHLQLIFCISTLVRAGILQELRMTDAGRCIYKVEADDVREETGVMVQSKGGGVARELGTLWSTGTLTGTTDAQLLQRFTLDRDATAELAFRELLERHAPMVIGVCRQIVRRQQDVDDAFQATFLVLVRKARSIQVRESLGPWLYRVAYRTAQRARASASRHASIGLEGVEAVDSAGDDGCASRPGPFSTTRSAVCRKSTGRPSCFATSKASHTKRPLAC